MIPTATQEMEKSSAAVTGEDVFWSQNTLLNSIARPSLSTFRISPETTKPTVERRACTRNMTRFPVRQTLVAAILVVLSSNTAHDYFKPTWGGGVGPWQLPCYFIMRSLREYVSADAQGYCMLKVVGKEATNLPGSLFSYFTGADLAYDNLLWYYWILYLISSAFAAWDNLWNVFSSRRFLWFSGFPALRALVVTLPIFSMLLFEVPCPLLGATGHYWVSLSLSWVCLFVARPHWFIGPHKDNQ